MPNAGFDDIEGLVMTAFLLIGGCGKSCWSGATTPGQCAHDAPTQNPASSGVP
jgi:hypothetical protein